MNPTAGRILLSLSAAYRPHDIMSFVTANAIQHIAESLSVSKVTQDASRALAPHIDVRLREIVQVQDIENPTVSSNESWTALLHEEDLCTRVKPYQSVRPTQEASKFSRHSKKSSLSSEDVNNALRFYNCQVMLISSPDPRGKLAQ